MNKRIVKTDSDHSFWYETKTDGKKWMVRLMKAWSGFAPSCLGSRKFRTEEKAVSWGEKQLDRLSLKYEGWS